MMMDNHQPVQDGKQAILQNLQAMFEQSSATIQITAAETQVIGDWAYDRGSFTVSITPKAAGGNAMQESGNYLVILRKGADGAWKLHRVMSNSDQPMMPAPAQKSAAD
jgi:ketosteroid isomerase-like protein